MCVYVGVFVCACLHDACMLQWARVGAGKTAKSVNMCLVCALACADQSRARVRGRRGPDKASGPASLQQGDTSRYECTHMHKAHKKAHTRAHTHTHTHTLMRVYLRAHVWKQRPLDKQVCVFVRNCVYVCVQLCVCVCVRAQRHVSRWQTWNAHT